MGHTLALHALPVYIREGDTEFFKTCEVSVNILYSGAN